MLDIVVTGGTAVLPSGAEKADIGIQGEKIVPIGAPGTLAPLGGRVVDATGQIVIPGGIDPHVHCRWPMPVPGQTQPNMTDGPDRVSQAALFGGTTTMLDFALVDGDNTVQQAIERRQQEWAGDCHCDYGFHVMVQGQFDHTIPDQLREAVAGGHATVKMFTTDITPSRKFADDQAALWAGTDYGAIQTVATDEIRSPLKYKLQGARIDDTTGGNAGVEPRVSLIYTETVEKRGRSLENFVGLISTNAAKIMGLYPRKGALAVGSDADIVLLDARKRHIVRAAEMHEADYSPWEGRDLAAWPSLTMLRGKVMVENGELKGALTDGKFLRRQVPDEIRTRPAG